MTIPYHRCHASGTQGLSLLTRLLLVALGIASAAGFAGAQQDPAAEVQSSTRPGQVAERIEVEPVSSDQAILKRLSSILQATGWFGDVQVAVEEGVVFLDGRTTSADYRNWAGQLAGKTRDVVAVVNRIEVAHPSPWDFSPALGELQALWERTQQRLPRVGLGLLVLFLVGMVAKVLAGGARKALGSRLNPLLRDVAVRLVSVLVLLIGFYLVLQIAGLSGLAATVLGGTGILGLVAGIAFRDILENYLASILISLRNPFRIGDLVEIAGQLGLVLRVTTRGTVLMNPDGNHVQIPNATVYKSIIRNFTANPNRRDCFEVGIGFENKIEYAQEVALGVLNRHAGVLKDPEAQVMVDRLGSATVNLKAYFWYDGSAFNGLKVKSSLIRLVKRAFEAEGISMPDEAREILFPEGVAVRMVEAVAAKDREPKEKHPSPAVASPAPLDTEAEGDLASEDEQLRQQASQSRTPETGANILQETP